MKTQKTETAKKEDAKNTDGKLIAAVRIRGAFTMDRDIKDTLRMLRLNRKNHCVLVRGTGNIKGMLQKVKDYITFGEISGEVLKRLIAKRGMIGSRRISQEEAESFANEVLKNGKSLLLKPVFRLTPASGGFREIKQHYPKGELGYRGEKINELLEKMM